METYHGHIRTPADAIILFEACRLGMLPRVQRRLSEKERQSIKSGSVFVWDEREAGMRRWTDGKSWSASRVSGSFLTYREMEGKRGGGGVAGSLQAQKSNGEPGAGDEGEEGPDGYRYKPDGLMKQSFSITTSTGQHLHLISYYSRTSSQNLNQPTKDPNLRHIRPAKGMYPESTVQEAAPAPVMGRGHVVPPPFFPPHYAMAMPGYARGGMMPPGPYAPPMAYGWPPSPMATPPNMYYAPFVPHPHPGAIPSPMPWIHHSYPQHQQPQMHGPPMIDRQSSTLPGHNISIQNAANRLPKMSAATAAQYQYNPNLSNPLPAPQSAQMPHPQIPPLQNHPPSGASQGTATGSSQPSDPSSLPVDPRLASPPPLKNGHTTTSSPPKTNGVSASLETNNSSSKVIPSINSLIHKPNSTAPEKLAQQQQQQQMPQTAQNGGVQADGTSPKPGTVEQRSNAHDIPNDKIGFGEDMRALRQLDKAFIS